MPPPTTRLIRQTPIVLSGIPTSDRNWNNLETINSPGTGIVTDCMIISTAGTIRRGQVYSGVYMAHRGTSGDEISMTLAGGYLQTSVPIVSEPVFTAIDPDVVFILRAAGIVAAARVKAQIEWGQQG